MTETKTGYTVEEVKAMAVAQGLPCRVLTASGVKTVHPLSTLEALGLVRVWSRFMTKEQLADDSFDRIARSNQR